MAWREDYYKIGVLKRKGNLFFLGKYYQNLSFIGLNLSIERFCIILWN